MILKGLEPRPNQSELVSIIENTFNNNGIALIEGKPGMGKTLAYCYAAAGVNSDTPIWISVPTIDLQEQCRKTLDSLADISDRSATYTVLKGLDNYACLRSMDEIVKSDELQPDEIGFVGDKTGFLGSELYKTIIANNGDINMIPDNGGMDDIVKVIQASHESCDREKCEYYNKCFYFIQREKAKSSKVIICNHAVLISSHEPKSLMIIDEAHGLPNVVSTFFTNSLSETKALQHINVIRKYSRYFVTKSRLSDFSYDLDRVKKIIKDTFTSLGGLVGDNDEIITSSHGVKKPLHEYAVNSIEPLVKKLSDFNSKLKRMRSLNPWLNHSIEQVSDMLKALNAFVSYEKKGETKIQITNTLSVQIIAVPGNLASYLRNNLWNNCNGVAFLSGTFASNLNTGKWYMYFATKLGVTFPDKLTIPKTMITKLFPHPYMWDKVNFIVASKSYPSIKTEDKNWLNKTSEVVSSICNEPTRKGGILILSGSHLMVNRISKLTENNLTHRELLVHSEGETMTRLVNKLKKSPDNYCLISACAWEGLDLPGDYLQTLIILKLPFPAINGGSNNFAISLSEAVTRFRQGVGRLIRDPGDSGDIFILDNRIITEDYGGSFLFKRIGVNGFFPINENQIVIKDL